MAGGSLTGSSLRAAEESEGTVRKRAGGLLFLSVTVGLGRPLAGLYRSGWKGVKMRVFLVLLLLAGPIEAQSKISWQGLWVGTARTASTRCFVCKPDVNIEANAIVGFGKRWNFQIELIQPLGNDRYPLIRFAVARRIF